MELEGNRIHAMPLIDGCLESLAFEDVPEMSTTSGAGDLSPGHSPRAIGVSRNCTRDGVEEGWPPAATGELVG